MAELSDKYVPGDGPIDSKVMIIGEAPGEKEDEEGRPFVGRAGQLLNRTLLKVGMPRESVYVTNIVPYRPEGNAKPTTEQIHKFAFDHLVPEYKKVRPEFVLLLGNTALHTVTNYTDGITKCRGWVPEENHTFGGYTKVYATFHPSAILRNPNLLMFFENDLLLFAERVYLSVQVHDDPLAVIKE